MAFGLGTPTKTSVIASGAVSGSAIDLESFEIMQLYVPTLTSSTLQLFGSVDGGATYAAIKDALGNTMFSYAAGTGNFLIDARDMAAFVGCTHIMPVCGTSQGAARTFTLRFKGT